MGGPLTSGPLNQFDVVRLLNIERVKWLSGPAGRPASPQGEWSIVGFIDEECILAKQSTLIRIPSSDIVRVADYSLEQLAENMRKAGSANIDIIAAVTKEMNISFEQAKQLCKKHNIPLKVDSRTYNEKALKQLQKILEAKDDQKS